MLILITLNLCARIIISLIYKYDVLESGHGIVSMLKNSNKIIKVMKLKIIMCRLHVLVKVIKTFFLIGLKH